MTAASLAKFIVVGVANTAVGVAVIWTAKILGASDVTANISGYAVGVTVSFLLNKQWTFSFRGRAGAPLLRFLFVFAVSYAANFATVFSLIGATRLDPFLCQLLGVAPYSALLYSGCRWYVFRSALAPSRGTRSIAG